MKVSIKVEDGPVEVMILGKIGDVMTESSVQVLEPLQTVDFVVSNETHLVLRPHEKPEEHPSLNPTR